MSGNAQLLTRAGSLPAIIFVDDPARSARCERVVGPVEPERSTARRRYDKVTNQLDLGSHTLL